MATAVSDNETHNETGKRKGPAAGKIKVPGWLHRLLLEVDNLRADIGRLESMRKAPSPRHSRLWSRFGLKDTVQLETLLEERKLRLKALAERIRRYKQQDEFRRMNKLFAWNEKAFYRELCQNEKRTGTEQEVAAQIPDKGEIEISGVGYSQHLRRSRNQGGLLEYLQSVKIEFRAKRNPESL